MKKQKPKHQKPSNKTPWVGLQLHWVLYKQTVLHISIYTEVFVSW